MQSREQMYREMALHCRRLMLSQEMVEYSRQKATPRQEEFLAEVLKHEVKHREEQRRQALVKRARLPQVKSLKDYDWSAVRLPVNLSTEDLRQCRYVTQKHNLVLFGPVGTGKTHLALALGLLACEQGREVRYYGVAELGLKLSQAHHRGKGEAVLKDLRKAELLILDEWGYLPLDRESGQHLFRVIAESYEQRSIILTTNLEFSKWGGVFADDQMTAAMIDRLAHHGHLILFEGESYRMKHALMKQQA